MSNKVSFFPWIGQKLLGFIGLAGPEEKARENAANWLELADKVYHFRRDLLTAAQLGELQAGSATLRALLKERAGAEKLKLGIESLEEVLKRTGGAIYPKSALVENVEFFLVAALVILGIRTYFVQPFKIPTNSMWPTYYGMKGENLPPEGEAPGLVSRTFRLLAFGAQRYTVTAPRSGEVSAYFFEGGALAYEVKPGRTWLVIPTQVKEYTFLVDGTPAKITVPLDFNDFDEMVGQTYPDLGNSYWAARRKIETTKDTSSVLFLPNPFRPSDRRVAAFPVNLGRTVKAGESILRFDLLTGDQLFVDRVSYHFMQPRIGQGFVFRTENIHSPEMQDGAGQQVESYYIKRLVGVPGDTLEVHGSVLYRNSQPITGADAFEANAQRKAPYTGYVAIMSLAPGKSITVPNKSFFAMGDNSSNSKDSRYWGFVPAKDAVGRPLFIYYPFTKRWGPSR